VKRGIVEIHILVALFMLTVWLFPTNFMFLIWNVFLALIPFDLSLLIKNRQLKRWMVVVLTLVWLIFFPNTMYMLTDFSHLSSIGTGLMTETQFFNYALLASGVMIGTLLGVSSAHIMAVRFLGGDARIEAVAFYAVLSLVSAFGIYLGRFLRLNSWDLVTNGHSVIQEVTQAFTMHSFVFVMSFGALQLALLLMYHILRKMK